MSLRTVGSSGVDRKPYLKFSVNAILATAAREEKKAEVEEEEEEDQEGLKVKQDEEEKHISKAEISGWIESLLRN